jgi:preprotein translocase subunit YajC
MAVVDSFWFWLVIIISTVVAVLIFVALITYLSIRQRERAAKQVQEIILQEKAKGGTILAISR